MNLRRLEIRNFRGHVDTRVDFSDGLTTLVGENSSGKSTIAMAISKILASFPNDGSGFPAWTMPHDYPGMVEQPMELSLEVELTEHEAEELLAGTIRRRLQEQVIDADHFKLALQVLANLRNIRVLCSHRPRRGTAGPVWDLGLFRARGDVLSLDAHPSWGGSHGSIQEFLNLIVNPGRRPPNNLYPEGQAITRALQDLLRDRIRILDEFRGRSQISSEKGVESPTGELTAQALLNLKNHQDRTKRARYRRIQEEFHKLFPQFEMEAVASSTGASSGAVQFTERGNGKPLLHDTVSAGVHQCLTLLVHLIGREGHFLVVDSPEQHLHPHSARFVARLVHEAAGMNQILLITHEPRFIDPSAWTGLRRLTWRPTVGPTILTPEPQTDVGLEKGKHALRDVDKRELLMARSAILVEDESQRQFLRAIAFGCGFDLDAQGISIVEVGGENGYPSYIHLLQAFNVPFVCLRDNHWGDDQRYPPPPTGTYYSLGMEIEDFLDAKGFKQRREKLRKAHGASKPRIANLLGASMSRDEVPPEFIDVLRRANDLVQTPT